MLVATFIISSFSCRKTYLVFFGIFKRSSSYFVESLALLSGSKRYVKFKSCNIYAFKMYSSCTKINSRRNGKKLIKAITIRVEMFLWKRITPKDYVSCINSYHAYFFVLEYIYICTSVYCFHIHADHIYLWFSFILFG